MKTWDEGRDFLTELKADADVTAHLSAAELDDMFDIAHHTRHVDTIFKRVFGAG
jgi:adenylosuccinate lyase